jgi:hypothetical protein
MESVTVTLGSVPNVMTVTIMVKKKPVNSSTVQLPKVTLWMRSAVDMETATPSVESAHVRKVSLALVVRISLVQTATVCFTHLIQPMHVMDGVPAMWKVEAARVHSHTTEMLVRNPSVLKTVWVWVAAMQRLESAHAQKAAVAQLVSSKTVLWIATLQGMATATDLRVYVFARWVS